MLHTGVTPPLYVVEVMPQGTQQPGHMPKKAERPGTGRVSPGTPHGMKWLSGHSVTGALGAPGAVMIHKHI